MALLKKWCEAFSYYCYDNNNVLDDGEIIEVPVINFRLDWYVMDMGPSRRHSDWDNNLWRRLNISLDIARMAYRVSVPFKKLPDYTPDEKMLARRKRYSDNEDKWRQSKLAAYNKDDNNG